MTIINNDKAVAAVAALGTKTYLIFAVKKLILFIKIVASHKTCLNSLAKKFILILFIPILLVGCVISPKTLLSNI